MSADPAYKKDVLKTAKSVVSSLKKAGADNVELHKTDGHPIVYGEKIIDKSLPTVLVYGHYDVQPPDPMELWDSHHHLSQSSKKQKFTHKELFSLADLVMIKARLLCTSKHLKLWSKPNHFLAM